MTIYDDEVFKMACDQFQVIADYLKAGGKKVLHIIGGGKVEEHPFTSAARIVQGKLSYSAAEGEGELALGIKRG